MITLSKTLRLFLDGIGQRDEYEFYLSKFQSDASACFALLCPDVGSIDSGLELLAFDLHFLTRLELVPAILLCGPWAGSMKSLFAKEALFSVQSFKPPVEVKAVLASIQQARREQKVPVVVTEQPLETVLRALLPGVAKRVHFMRAEGGLRSASGDALDYVYTHRENQQILESLEVDYPSMARSLLDQHTGVHLSVTSPIHLLEEIFTVKGAGTVFRRGSTLFYASSIAEVDQARLTRLLQESFGKALHSPRFFEGVSHAYLEENYRGAVLLEQLPEGLYLSKFAVDKEARGEGLALELWRETCRNHAAFFWRSSRENPFNAWYDKQADGRQTAGKWKIFWRGLPAEAISSVISYCTTRGEDFAPVSAGE